MKRVPVIIFARDEGWILGSGNSLRDVPVSSGASPEQIANEIAGMLDSAPANVTLAIPASWCLSATVALTGLPSRNRKSALLYRLELSLPLTAEEVVADYIFDEPNSALAICTSSSATGRFIDAIQTAGVAIQSIVPASIYATQFLFATEKPGTCEAIIWQSGNSVELFIIRAGGVAGWYLFPATTDDLEWHLEQLFPISTVPRKMVARSLQPDLLDMLKRQSIQLISNENRSVEACVMSGINAGLLSSIDLRRDGLAPANAYRAIRRPLRELLIATLVLVVTICSTACWRATQLESLANNYRAQQRQLFTDTFPGHSVPTNILSRLRSEERSLHASGSRDRQVLVPQSALPVFQSILSAINSLPTDVRLSVEDLKSSEGRFSLDGLVRDRADLSALVSGLQQSARLRVDPPQTEQMAGKGLHVTVNGAGTAENKPK